MLESLRHESGGRWHISEFRELYSTEEQARAYDAIHGNEAYSDRMHGAEVAMLQRHKSDIVNCWSERVAVIDLGCGMAENTVIVLDEAVRQGKRPHYHPVDLNNFYLKAATERAQKIGAKVTPHSTDIHDIAGLAASARGDNALNFWLSVNFSNFPYLLGPIAAEMRHGDTAFFAVQLLKDANLALSAYRVPELVNFLFLALERAGVRKEDAEYFAEVNNATMESGFIVKKVPDELRRRGVAEGDRIVVMRSFKPTLERFEKMLSAHFRPEIKTDDDGDFAIALCHSK
jgi:uncharacterized SAM-dependent methyltransferase